MSRFRSRLAGSPVDREIAQRVHAAGDQIQGAIRVCESVARDRRDSRFRTATLVQRDLTRVLGTMGAVGKIVSPYTPPEDPNEGLGEVAKHIQAAILACDRVFQGPRVDPVLKKATTVHQELLKVLATMGRVRSVGPESAVVPEKKAAEEDPGHESPSEIPADVLRQALEKMGVDL